MGVELVCKSELEAALNDTRFLKVQYQNSDKIDICPIFIAAKDTIDVLLQGNDINSNISIGTQVVCKFEHKDYEYVIDGSILDVCEVAPVTVTIQVSEIKKIVNRRKDIRYEVDINGVLRKINGSKQTQCIIKNISRGGAAITCNRGDLDKGKSEVVLQTTTDDSVISIKAKVLRKTEINAKDNTLAKHYSYGLQFKDITPEQSYRLDMFISDIVKGYEKLLANSFVRIQNKNATGISDYFKAVFVDSGNSDIAQLERYIKKLGVEISILRNISFLMDCIEKEKPNIVIIDLEDKDDFALQLITGTIQVYHSIQFFLVSEFDDLNAHSMFEGKQNVDFLYKPFIYSEIEQKVMKHL